MFELTNHNAGICYVIVKSTLRLVNFRDASQRCNNSLFAVVFVEVLLTAERFPRFEVGDVEWLHFADFLHLAIDLNCAFIVSVPPRQNLRGWLRKKVSTISRFNRKSVTLKNGKVPMNHKTDNPD